MGHAAEAKPRPTGPSLGLETEALVAGLRPAGAAPASGLSPGGWKRGRRRGIVREALPHTTLHTCAPLSEDDEAAASPFGTLAANPPRN